MRRRRQTGETRLAIIRAAHRVFGRADYADVTINDIIAEATVSRGTYYGYFSGKEDVFAAVWKEVAENTRREMRLPEAGGRHHVPRETEPAQVRRLIYERVLLDIITWRREPTLMRATIVFKVLHPEFVLPVLEATRESIRTASEWIARDKEAGYLNDVEPDVATFALAAMLDWFLFQVFGSEFVTFPNLTNEELAEQLTTLWFGGAYRSLPSKTAEAETHAPARAGRMAGERVAAV
jgi:AcrR family transcriptional regulator